MKGSLCADKSKGIGNMVVSQLPTKRRQCSSSQKFLCLTDRGLVGLPREDPRGQDDEARPSRPSPG